jgi:hypothetical protein
VVRTRHRQRRESIRQESKLRQCTRRLLRLQ